MAHDAAYWQDELKRYSDQFQTFVQRGKKIIKRYRDERRDSEMTEAKFNILWSNIQTIKPAIYSRPPKVEVSRRFKDQDDSARVASMILERGIEFELKHYGDYHDSLSQCVDDRLLPGRGVAWIRYEPETETVEEPQISEDLEIGEGDYQEAEESQLPRDVEPYERITNERTIIDYVYWQDFAHQPARTWEEVQWVARRVYIGKREGEERFGDVFKQVPMSHVPEGMDEKTAPEGVKKAEVWEIWCKSSAKVYWLAAHFDQLLDEREDPLELENFFPCPKPLFSTVTTDSLIPVADFVLYQDQADEIDEITSRIRHLTKALKVMGVYAADEKAIERLMKEGNDAVLVPVTNWGAFIEKGGLQNAVQFIPLKDIVQSLQQLYVARESCKQIIYETTGLSDIIRGASMASETATAQQIKSQFASIRLNAMKDDVARFARDLLRMKAELICSKYQPETIIKMSGILQTPDAQFAEQAIIMLKDEPIRNFSIDIETDTLVELDEQQDKQSRVEFLTAAGGFLREAVQAGQQDPSLTPVLGQMLLFGVRGFKVGRELEGVFEQYLAQSLQKSQQPVQPPQDQGAAQAQAQMQIEQMKSQMEMQIEQARMQADQAKSQAELQLEQGKMQHEAQIEQAKAQYQAEIERERMAVDADLKWRIAQLEAETQVVVAQINTAAKESVKTTETESNANVESALATALNGFQAALENLSKPKTVIRGADGKIMGVQ